LISAASGTTRRLPSAPPKRYPDLDRARPFVASISNHHTDQQKSVVEWAG
jgi:hypothetical protein